MEEEKLIEMKCSSCGKRIEAENKWIEFKCPKCGKEAITRCERCKKMENSYACPKCGFTGP